MRRFDEERYYLTTDPELLLLGTPAALAKKRSRGEGPTYHKVGKRVLYRGRDLNRFLDECVIEPTCGRDGSDPSEPGTDSGEAAAGFAVVPRSGGAPVRQSVEPAASAV